ncbi:MAG: hypothetical protein UT33_C0014G0003 [Candidatus Peregrinibacteria bacterium GW2011_GWC2_39_14]|nr:MAG: hypothetical protein US92_C0008G0003 [Candidatus Peregrinibacteria bacterium GW2011_GWA2_38_36]KKR05005.1 MAG: hypothetical protein UT33_C0014G0003 [Candidatus Peregrinibacteria bacterium GW2011_GWC2_39_14]
MVILYLILAHLIADFMLQPSKLVKWKSESVKGVIVHAGIHVVVTLILILPYLNLATVGIVLLLGAVHAFIDRTKIDISLKSDKFVRYFILDQLVHFVTIILAGLAISSLKSGEIMYNFIPSIYSDPYFVIFLILGVFLSYTMEIYNYTVLMQHQAFGKAKFHYGNMVLRILALAVVYAIFVVVGFIVNRLA